MAYTKDGIMAQVYVAFGQGTGEVRVEQALAVALKQRYYEKITQDLIDHWDTEAVQVLERIRAIGRQLGTEARLKGRTKISARDFDAAAQAVEVESRTLLCGPPPTPLP